MAARLCLLVVLAAITAGSALAAPGDPQKRHTPADQRWASSIVLRRADLGTDWKVQPSGGSDSPKGCPAFRPDESDLVETGDGEGRDFARLGAFVGSGSTVYRSEHDARTSWSRIARPGLVKCVSSLLEQATNSQGVATTVSYKGSFPFPKLAPRTAAYRLRFVATTKGVRLGGRVDLVLLGDRRADAVLMLMSFDRPFVPVTASFERGLAAKLAHRLHR